MQAIKIRMIRGMTGEAYLYKVDPPIKQPAWYEEEEISYRYVVVSRTYAFTGFETYIFPAEANGRIINFGALEGSRRGHIGCDELLESLGYEVITNCGART